jgi:peptide/nickel transport system substrate-binding protein
MKNDRAFEDGLRNLIAGRATRREVLRRAALLGLGTAAIGPLLAACRREAQTPAPGGVTPPPESPIPGAATPTTAETPAGGTPTPAERQVLNYGVNAADITTLDPHFAAATQDRNIVDMVFNGLIRYKPGDSTEFEPDLAEEIPEPEETADGKQVWTFKLRQGVMWHAGPQSEAYELRADDVIYSLQKSANKDRSAYSADYANITFEKVDDYTVRIIVDPPLSPTLFLPKVANYNGGFIVSQRAVEAMGDEAIKIHPIGTGPFKFKSYASKDRVELEANDDYFRGAPKLAGVQVRFMSDATSRELALKSGEMDVVGGVSDSTWVQKINQEPNLQADVFGVGEVAFLNLNIAREPLNDIRVRQAILYAIDRDAHLAVFGGPPVAENVFSVVPAQFMPGGLTQEEAEQAGVAYGRDLDRARQLLAEAGLGGGFSLKLVTSEMDAYRKNYEVLQEELREIGIAVELDVVDHSTMHRLIREDVNPIVIYIAFRPNADVYLTQFFHSDSIVVTGPKPNTNFSHYDQIDDLIEQARVETDPERQEELWKQANIRILQDAIGFPLHYINQVYGRSKAVDYGHELKSSLALYPGFTEQTTVRR